MPLVHPSKPQFRKYLTEKISGRYNLAFAYKKPMLCPEDMAVYEDFKDTSVFYNLNNFADFINNLSVADTTKFIQIGKVERGCSTNQYCDIHQGFIKAIYTLFNNKSRTFQSTRNGYIN